MTRLALVTHAALPQLSDDDRLLLPCLEAHGMHAEPAAWDDPSVRWSTYDALVMRSAWNYHLEPDAFQAWLAEIDALGVPLWNPPALLRWNADKRYLFELSRRGVPIPSTQVTEPGGASSLRGLLEERGWTEVVVKPVVSASAHETWRVHGEPTADDEARFARLAADRPMMVQRFVPQVVRDGEWSLMFFAGAFSHAVVKRPIDGDFRVQREHGGTAHRAVPSEQLLDDARVVMRLVPHPTLYGRVDGCSLGGRLLLMELELLEPSLFLGHDQDAPARLADAVARVALRRP